MNEKNEPLLVEVDYIHRLHRPLSFWGTVGAIWVAMMLVIFTAGLLGGVVFVLIADQLT